MIVKMKNECGSFAEDKDAARRIRETLIRPAFESGREPIVLDFSGVDSSTQSFMHALMSDFFRVSGDEALSRFEFKGCTKPVKSLVATVIGYSME